MSIMYSPRITSLRNMDGNNEIKVQATKDGNELMRKLPKDLSNIIFGKSIQDILKQRNFEIVYVPDDREVSRLNYIDNIISMKCISEKLIIVEKEKKVIRMNMPIFIGKAVLDLSKELMYDFFHNVVMKHLISQSQALLYRYRFICH